LSREPDPHFPNRAKAAATSSSDANSPRVCLREALEDVRQVSRIDLLAVILASQAQYGFSHSVLLGGIESADYGDRLFEKLGHGRC
jgi:hypothetical protein